MATELGQILNQMIQEAQQVPATLGPEAVLPADPGLDQRAAAGQAFTGAMGPPGVTGQPLPSELGPLGPRERQALGGGFGPVFAGAAVEQQFAPASQTQAVDPREQAVGLTLGAILRGEVPRPDLEGQVFLPGAPGAPELTLEGVRRKFRAGQQLSQAELDLMLSGPGGALGAQLSGEQAAFLASGGQLATAVAIPTVLGAAGAGGGSLLAGPPGSIGGAAVGSALGTAINQFFGLENDDDFNLLMSFLIPAGTGAVTLTGRGLTRAGVSRLTRTGSLEREVAQAEIAQRLRSSALSAPSTGLTETRIANLGATPVQLPGRSLTGLAGVTSTGKGQIARASGLSVRELDSLSRGRDLSPRELFDLRQSMVDRRNELSFGAGRRASIGSRVKEDARLLDDSIQQIDDHVDELARRGPTDPIGAAAMRFQGARRAVTLRDAQDELARFVGRHSKGSSFNVNAFIDELDVAQEAVRRGQAHPLEPFTKQLDDLGERASFADDIRQIRQLAEEGRLNFVEQRVADVVQAGQGLPFATGVGGALGAFAGDVMGLAGGALAGMMLNRVGRGFLIKVLNQSRGRLSFPVLALGTVAVRAAEGNLSAEDRSVMEFINQFGRLPEIFPEGVGVQELSDIGGGVFQLPTEAERRAREDEGSIVGRFRRRIQDQAQTR